MSIEFDRFSVDVWPLAVVVLLILLLMRWRRERNLISVLCAALFGVYILYAIGRLFFPLPIGGGYAEARRAYPFWSNASIIPFFFLPPDVLRLSMRGLALNIALTIPLGFGINLLTSLRPSRLLWLAPLAGVGIETVQLAVSFLLGYLYRVIDINDVIMNALGVWIGYALFRLFVWVYTAVLQRPAFWQHSKAPE